jgi:hypothetical protein
MLFISIDNLPISYANEYQSIDSPRDHKVLLDKFIAKF